MEGYAKLQVNGNEKDDVIFIPIQVHIPSEICPQTISSSWMVSVVSRVSILHGHLFSLDRSLSDPQRPLQRKEE